MTRAAPCRGANAEPAERARREAPPTRPERRRTPPAVRPGPSRSTAAGRSFVKAFDGATLTIALAVGGALTAVVDDGTEVGCDEDPRHDDERGRGVRDEEDLDDRDWGDEELDGGEVFSVRARLAEEGDEHDADDEDWGDDALGDCTAGIAPGTPVHEAAVEGGMFVALELLP